MDYHNLNKIIDFGVEKAIRHNKFNDETDWYILLSRIRIWTRSGLCER
jgi:hypothetical protein